MMKFRINKDKIIKNGTTTIVTGTGDLGMYDNIMKLVAALAVFNGTSVQFPETKGVAKLSPDDVYDEATGLKVATRKAELKARKRAIISCLKCQAAVSEFFHALTAEVSSNCKRIEALTKELDEVNK